MNAKEAAKVEACAKLREHVRPGDTVHTILRHVSRSGMQRSICPVLTARNLSPWTPWGIVATAIGATPDRDRGGVVMRGCGTDMGFDLVYNLAATLFREGFGCVGDGCPSNDHSNGDRDYTPHGFSISGCAGAKINHWHKDGGYALRQRWL